VMPIADPFALALGVRAALSETKSQAPIVDSWASELVRAFENDASRAYSNRSDRDDFRKTQTCRQVLEHSNQAELVAAILVRLQDLHAEGPAGHDFWPGCWLLEELAGHLLRQPLSYSQERLAIIIEHCATSLVDWHFANWHNAPVALLLRQVEHAAGGDAAHARLTAAVVRLSEEAMRSRRVGSPLRGALARLVERLSGDRKQTAGLAASPWRDKVLAEIGRLADEAAETSRRALEQAAGAAGKSKPSQAFLKAARSLSAEDRGLAVRLIEWVEAYLPDPRSPDPNDDVIRGLLWMLAAGEGEDLASRIGRYCELCFKKVPNVGARSAKLGNGAIQTLAIMGGTHVVAELTRLKGRIRYPPVVRWVETTLSDLAARLGIGEDELEEMALPTYGLSAGSERRLPVGDGSAIIRVVGTRDVHLSWTRSDGREVASVPKALKEAAPEALTAARRIKKEVEGALQGQCARIESLYLSGRRIAFDHWQKRYVEHPLVAGLTRRLIWRFESPRKHVAGLPRHGAIEDVWGHSIERSPDLTVTLWHPLHAAASDVLAWRKRLAELGVSQPFKQAHREVYVVTEAERQTNVYSNRFAAHVLRQHQFKALCDERGWRYSLMGDWDSHNTPTRTLPRRRLAVEYWVDRIEGPAIMASGVYAVIATDQVRFVGPDCESIPVSEVPPLLFSELMRDVDLFVGVASVGNDPNWVDGGPGGRFQVYWGNYAFGTLAESGKTRAEALAALLPQLAIAGQCALEDRFLVVRGKLRTYRIHLGSANTLMEPNNQYLCIVPGRSESDRSKPAERLVLPFEGDNVLSIILSKAFLLAADDKITDPTILRQINHRP
jgi:hypothetical protein